jgi:amidase
MIPNTAPFDISHHPAMAVPCGMSDGLRVSVMLIGKDFDEPSSAARSTLSSSAVTG